MRFLYRHIMKISDRQPKISDNLKISDSLECCSTRKHPQQYAYALPEPVKGAYNAPKTL